MAYGSMTVVKRRNKNQNHLRLVNENTSMDRYSDQYVNLAYDKIEQNIIDSICLVKHYFYKEKYSFVRVYQNKGF